MEYAGYVPSNIVDWNAIGKSLNENYKGVKQAWETRAVEAEQLQQAGQKVLDETDKASNETLNTFVVNSADTIRQQLLDLSRKKDKGEIKHSEWKKQYNNIMSSWGSFAQKLQGMDQYLVEFSKRQQVGEDGLPPAGSALEGFNLEDAMGLRDFTNKQVKLGEDGRVFIFDKNDPNNVIDASTLLNIENLFDNRLDLSSSVTEKVKPLGKFVEQYVKTGGREVSLEDITNREEYKKAEVDMIYSIANPNDPRSIAGILIDNSSKQYKYYRTEAQKNDAIAEAISKQELVSGAMSDSAKKDFAEKFIKENLIQVVQGVDGNRQPVVTEDHIKEAHEIVRNQMRSQLDRVYQESRGFAPSGSGGGGGSGSDDPQGDLYPKLLNAWQLAGTSGNPEDPVASADTFSALAKGKYTFKWGKDGLEIYKGVYNDDPMYSQYKVNERVATVKKLEDASPYFYGYSEAKGVGGAIGRFNEERNRYRSNNPSGGNKPPKKFN